AAVVAHDRATPAATGIAAVVAHDRATPAATAAATMIADDGSSAVVRARGGDARGEEKHDADGSKVATHGLDFTGSGASFCLEFKAM
ncbi:MAG TPA: hypothetical protein VF469_07920, partial [Kofleriaceae bacterium]